MGLAKDVGRKDAAYKRAVDMLKKTAMIDGHNDLPWVIRRATNGDLARFDLTKVHPETDTDIPRLKAGMVTVQVLAAFLPSDIENPATVTLEQIDLVRRIEARHSDVFLPIRRSTDITAAKRKGKIGSLISVEGTVGCEGSLAPIRMWHQLGVRLITLCHNGSLPWVDSSTDRPKAGGLSPFGKELVAELNRLGIIIDLSHASVEAAHAVIAASSAPVVLSHSNAHALCPHPRNAPDDLIKAVAASGGVVMATFVPSFINPDLWSRIEKAKRARWPGATPAERAAMQDPPESEIGPLPLATLAQYCDHVEYLLKLIGPDHVGIGGDFYGGEQPVGLEDATVYPSLFAELIRRGHGEQVLSRVAGANFLRVMRKVERNGRQIAKDAKPAPKTRARRPVRRRAALVVKSASR
ncbi:MAG: dipeptidase [Hyphomicrobiales bacterium]|nr:dipeptidase [Hyphomicrobiales bacterium]